MPQAALGMLARLLWPSTARKGHPQHSFVPGYPFYFAVQLLYPLLPVSMPIFLLEKDDKLSLDL